VWVFWTCEQTKATSKCDAGLSCYRGQQTISPPQTTSAAAFVKFHPPSLLVSLFCRVERYNEASVYLIVLGLFEVQTLQIPLYLLVFYIGVI